MGTYALQAVLALHHLHAAGADAVAEALQMLLYLTNFPRKKNDNRACQSELGSSVDPDGFGAFCKPSWLEVKILKPQPHCNYSSVSQVIQTTLIAN